VHDPALEVIPIEAVASGDVQVLAARGSVFVSRDHGHTWSELGRGLPADRYTLSPVDGGVVADGIGGVFVCNALDCAGPAFGMLDTAGTISARVTEFYNTTLDHYFITGDESEKASHARWDIRFTRSRATSAR
jgi:hypothetical protein